MRVIKYLRLPFLFDAGKMQRETDALSDMQWKLHYQVLHYEGEWSGLPLRSIGGNTDDLLISPFPNAEYRDTELLGHCPYFKEIISNFHCPLKAVRLLKLKAGAVIKEHVDGELNFERGEARIHIPVRTHEAVEFYLHDERITMKEGECWYMNFNLPHRVNNRSNTDRIHLVMDMQVNDWLKDLFHSKEITEQKIFDTNEMIDEKTRRLIIQNLRSMNTPKSNEMADEMEAGLLNKE